MLRAVSARVMKVKLVASSVRPEFDPVLSGLGKCGGELT
jgi:hypothetical protein